MIVKKEEKEARLRTAHTLLDDISIFSDGMCRGTVKTFNPSKYRMIESQLGKDAHVYPNGDCYFYLVDNRDKDFHNHLSGMCNRLAFLFIVLLPDILKENESATIHIKYKENKILLSKHNQLGWVEVYPDASYFRCTGYRFEKFSTKIWEVRDQLFHVKKLVGEATHIIIYYDWDERMKSHYSRVTGYKWSEVDGTICAGTESLSLK